MPITLPVAVNVLRYLIWETFWQSIASRIYWVLLTVTAVAVLFCFGVGVTGSRLERDSDERIEFIPAKDKKNDPKKLAQAGIQVIHGDLTLAFGAVRVPHARGPEDSVRGVQLLLANGIAGTLGVLLTLVWTAGFLPTFLEPNAASVLLSKPVPRWLVLAGKYVGINLFVGLQATIFVLGTWSALGLATGVWEPGYLLTIPLLMIQFAFFYSFSMFLAVATRSTIVSIIGTVLFWLLCNAVNAGRVEIAAQAVELPAWVRGAAEVAYWLLPKPVDMGKLMSDVLHGNRYFAEWSALRDYRPGEMSIVSSLAFAAVALLAAARDFVQVDY
jgi:ABC-type transport system involved in multi-copper enzyme maturation permease subunit